MKVQPTTQQLIAMLYERLPELFDRPQRTWVGLTDDEKHEAVSDEIGRIRDYEDYARAIEAKLKEKNT